MSGLFTVPELAIGVGLSEAASAAFEPKVEVPKQQAWANNPQRVPDLGLIAELIAGGKVSMDDGKNMANRLGFSDGTMESLVWLSQDRLNFATMLRLWRRFGAFDAGDDATLSDLLDQTIAHERLDWNYREWLRKLKTAELIGLGDIATAIVRGAVPAPSWVPVAPPTTTDRVPRFPVTDLDPVKLAAALGFDEDMLRIMTARSGLSLAPILATQALFRGILTDNDWLLAIAEGDLRTEWATTLRDAARQILTAGEYSEAELRGYIDTPTRRKNTAKHGMSDADSDLLHLIQGRPLAVHQVTTGLARGGTYGGLYTDVPEPYRDAIRQSNIKEPWAVLDWHNRYSYPSAFVLRTLATGGELTPGDTNGALLALGWVPELAAKVTKVWTGATLTGATPTTVAEATGAWGNAAGQPVKTDPYLKKAEGQLWTACHKAYTKNGITVDQVTVGLDKLAIDPEVQAEIIALWDVEKQVAADVPPAA